MTELETIEDEARQAGDRLVRGCYELVFAGASTYIVFFVLGGSVLSLILAFAALICVMVGMVDVIDGGTRYVLANREARQLKALPAARVHRLPP